LPAWPPSPDGRDGRARHALPCAATRRNDDANRDRRIGDRRARRRPRARRQHAVTLYEAAPRPGGHVYTVEVDGLAIDLGFIVCNRERYPEFFRMLGELQIATRPTTMSFSVSIPGEAGEAGKAGEANETSNGLEWGSASLSAVFADRRRLFDPRHWRFLAQVLAFVRRARRDLGAGLARASLDEYLARRRTSREVRDQFVVPLAAALWSLAPDRCGAFRPRPSSGSSISTACCGRSDRWRGTRSSAAAGATSTPCSPACRRPGGSRSRWPPRSSVSSAMPVASR